MSPSYRDTAARTLILDLLKSAATAVADVGITSLHFTLGNVSCSPVGSRRAAAGRGSVAAFETVIAFQVCCASHLSDQAYADLAVVFSQET